MLTRDEIESMIDAAQTTTDSRAVVFLAEVARNMHAQLVGVEAALYAAGKRPPECSTEDAVRFAVGMQPNSQVQP